MPRIQYRINNTGDLDDIVLQLNNALSEITKQLQRIEGFEGYTTEFYGDIQHKDSTAQIGWFNTTKASQQSHIADAETSHSTATTSDLDALGTTINSIISVLETFGYTASS